MGDQAQALDAFAGHADDMEDRQPVRLGPHHPVERGQFPDPVGGGQDRRAPDTGVAVGGVGRIEFVGATHPVQSGDSFDGVVDREGVITGNAEDLVDAESGQSLQGVFGDRR